MGEIKRLLTTAQVAEIFSASPDTVRRWRRVGKLRGLRVGREWRWRTDDIERLLAVADEPVQRDVQIDGAA